MQYLWNYELKYIELHRSDLMNLMPRRLLFLIVLAGYNYVQCNRLVPISLRRHAPLKRFSLKADNAYGIHYGQEPVDLKGGNEVKSASTVEMFGVPKAAAPAFAAFILDSIAVGLVMPCLPFFVVSFGANTFHLSMILSANFAAQMIGSVAMGRVSDILGRKRALLRSDFSYSVVRLQYHSFFSLEFALELQAD